MGQAPNGTALDEDARTTGCKSAATERIEVITRGERRRVWTPEQKREIVAESLAPGLTAAEVASKHGIVNGTLKLTRDSRNRQLETDPPRVLARASPRGRQIASP